MWGKGVSDGIAIGTLQFFRKTELVVHRLAVEDPQAEVARFENARALAVAQLSELAVRMGEKLGEQNSLLFEIHKMMLEDTDYQDSVLRIINEERVCAEYAVDMTAKQFQAMFTTMDDEYMKERAADVLDVSRRVLEILTGSQRDVFLAREPVILAAEDFAPSETAQFDRNMVLGLITSGGSANSHTAIFARTMGIPAVISLGGALTGELDGKQIIMNGSTGEVIVDPDASLLEEYAAKQREEQACREALDAYRGVPSCTQSGKVVKLYANIGSAGDIDAVLGNDAEGIGLFRSEFLYLESEAPPTEEAQFQAYKTVLKKMDGKPVIIRTLDIGADKQVAYLGLPNEENPALGMRAIRICLTRPDVFKTQLRALFRASVFGNLKIMFPMITSADEINQIKDILREVKSALERDGLAYDKNVEIGIMIETPAAAIISDRLAELVDFFSIGTNDLTQYTLAVDRQNDAIESFCNPRHEALLRLIRYVVENAHKNGIWAGVCGELAAEEDLTQWFVEIGVDELSVVPSAILPLRKRVRMLPN